MAEKLWPAVLIFEPKACPRRTVMAVPAGTSAGAALAGCGLAGAAGSEFAGAACSAGAAMPLAVEPLEPLLSLLLGLELPVALDALEPAGLLVQPSAKIR